MIGEEGIVIGEEGDSDRGGGGYMIGEEGDI